MSTKTLAEFLSDRIAEDEAEAHQGFFSPLSLGGLPSAPERRILAECEAKRRIVEQSIAWDRSGGVAGAKAVRVALRFLAAVYADHPDYREDWRP